MRGFATAALTSDPVPVIRQHIDDGMSFFFFQVFYLILTSIKLLERSPNATNGHAEEATSLIEQDIRRHTEPNKDLVSAYIAASKAAADSTAATYCLPITAAALTAVSSGAVAPPPERVYTGGNPFATAASPFPSSASSAPTGSVVVVAPVRAPRHVREARICGDSVLTLVRRSARNILAATPNLEDSAWVFTPRSTNFVFVPNEALMIASRADDEDEDSRDEAANNVAEVRAFASEPSTDPLSAPFLFLTAAAAAKVPAPALASPAVSAGNGMTSPFVMMPDLTAATLTDADEAVDKAFLHQSTTLSAVDAEVAPAEVSPTTAIAECFACNTPASINVHDRKRRLHFRRKNPIPFGMTADDLAPS